MYTVNTIPLRKRLFWLKNLNSCILLSASSEDANISVRHPDYSHNLHTYCFLETIYDFIDSGVGELKIDDLERGIINRTERISNSKNINPKPKPETFKSNDYKGDRIFLNFKTNN